MKLEFVVEARIESPNRRGHWTVHFREKKKLKQALLITLLSFKRLHPPASIILHRVGHREMDYDNLVAGFKPARDIIADWLIPGKVAGKADGDKRLKWTYSQEAGLPRKEKPYLKITIDGNTDKLN